MVIYQTTGAFAEGAGELPDGRAGQGRWRRPARFPAEELPRRQARYGSPLAARAASKGRSGYPEPADVGTTLGQPVATNPYGMPSKFESQLLRRESPGLARVGGASVSLRPLQGLFGIITPSGPAFRAPSPGLAGCRSDPPSPDDQRLRRVAAEKPKVTMDELMRLPRYRASTSSNAVPTPAWNGATSPCRPCNTRTACCPARNSPACR